MRRAQPLHRPIFREHAGFNRPIDIAEAFEVFVVAFVARELQLAVRPRRNLSLFEDADAGAVALASKIAARAGAADVDQRNRPQHVIVGAFVGRQYAPFDASVIVQSAAAAGSAASTARPNADIAPSHCNKRPISPLYDTVRCRNTTAMLNIITNPWA